MRIIDHKIVFKSTKPPDDTIWLNRGVSKSYQCKMGILSAFIIVVTTMITFFLFSVETQYKMYINYRANPPGVVCDALFDTYGVDRVQYMASMEYLYLNYTQAKEKDVH